MRTSWGWARVNEYVSWPVVAGQTVGRLVGKGSTIDTVTGVPGVIDEALAQSTSVGAGVGGRSTTCTPTLGEADCVVTIA